MDASKQQFNIYLPADLVRAVKHAAIDEGRSLSGFVEDVLRAHLGRAATPAGAAPAVDVTGDQSTVD